MTHSRDDDEHAYSKLARRGEDLIEAIGEYFIEQRFVTNCTVPDKLFSTARVERFTRGKFPRILLDPALIDQPISRPTLLTSVVSSRKIRKRFPNWCACCTIRRRSLRKRGRFGSLRRIS